MFRTTFDVGPDEREAFQELSRELADWRLGEYLDRSAIGTDDGIVCKLSHANRRPILFLPDRRDVRHHRGENLRSDRCQSRRQCRATARRSTKRTPYIIKRLVRPDAGLPGTNVHVVFRNAESGWMLEPFHQCPDAQTLSLWAKLLARANPRPLGSSILGQKMATRFRSTCSYS